MLARIALLLCLCAAPAAAGEMRWRLIDGFGPFYDEARPAPRSWAMPYGHIDEAEAPFVNEAHVAASVERFRTYCDEVSKLGYTHIIVGNLIHMATFQSLEGPPVYEPGSPHLARALKYKAMLRRCAVEARARGLRLVLETDFPAWTPPLQRWIGALDPDNPRLWQATRAAFEEAMIELGIGAISVRIGEGGGAYDESTGYASGVIVRTVAGTQQVLSQLLDIVDELDGRDDDDKRLLFRTWTIGIGEIGALHTNPGLYRRVFAPFSGRRSLITLMKHVAMDFFEYIPPNPTIGIGDIPQIVEFQARREYEAFGILPNYRGRAFKEDMQRLRGLDSVVGMSIWPTNGGFLMSAPLAYGCGAPTPWIDGNVVAYARLADDPDADPRAIARRWAVREGVAGADAEVVASILMESAEVVRRGLYIRPYAEHNFSLAGLDVFPTMIWLYWTRPVAAVSAQALVYRGAKRDLEAAIGDGAWAVGEVRRQLVRAQGIADSPLKAELVAALEYEASYLEVLADYRRVFLNHHRWADSGDAEALARWREARPELAASMAAHREAYRGSRRFPAMDLQELDRELADAEAAEELRPLAGLWAVALAILGALAGLSPFGRAPEAARQMVEGRASRGFLTVAVGLVAGAPAILVCGHQAGLVVGVTGGLLLAGLSLSAFAAGVIAPRRWEGPERRGSAAALAMLAPLMLLAALALAAFAWRGPAILYQSLVTSLFCLGMRLILLAIALGLPLTSALLGMRALKQAGASTRGAGLGGVVMMALALAPTLAAGWCVGLAAVVPIARITRMAPTILGEAGTGVEDLTAVGE